MSHDRPARTLRTRSAIVVCCCVFFALGGCGFLQGSGGMWLWKSDGTHSGTVRIKRLPGLWRETMPIVRVGDTAFFAATNGRSGTELWKTDGTPAGTVRVKHLAPGVDRLVAPFDRAVAGRTLFFTIDDQAHGVELWKSDGTPNGTGLVKDIEPGPGSSHPTDFVTSGGTLFFTLDDRPGELWKSDGSEAGTTRIEDLPSRDCREVPMLVRGPTLFFTVAGRLWKSDGAPKGAAVVKDVPSGPRCGARLFELGDAFLIVGARAVWRSDGTAEGTRLVKDFAGLEGRSLWIHDGTDFSLERADDPSLARSGNAMFFMLRESDQEGMELWRSDGTPAGTRVVKRFGAGLLSNTLVAIAGTVFVTADDGIHGVELWKSDGTPEGTALVKDLIAGPRGSEPTNLVDAAGRLFFTSFAAEGSREHWLRKSDGTPAGTSSVYEDPRTYPIGIANHLAAVGGSVYWLE